ncbi:MAG: Tfp pilus assembly protein PilF [Planctomycetota bacterium]|jgi:Tfp pilus assembly protein PilF
MASNYLKAHPNDAQANLMIGLSHYRADNHGAARPFFETALALDPNYYITHDYLADALFMLGDMTGSREHYELFASFSPAVPKTYVRLGMIDLEETHVEQAVEQFNHALLLYENSGKKGPAVYEAQRAELAAVHARLGDVFFARSDYEAARDELLKSTQIWPRNISAFFTLSLVYRRLGEDVLASEAAEYYESARRSMIEQQGRAQR